MKISHKYPTDIPPNHEVYIHELKMKSAQRRAKLDSNWNEVGTEAGETEQQLTKISFFFFFFFYLSKHRPML
jgi:hypothetical protein